MEDETLQPTSHRTPDDSNAGARAAGIWTAVGALLLTVSLALHPPPEAETGAFMELIAAEGTMWQAVHWLAAAALASLVVAGLLALSASDLARGGITKSAWGVLTVGALSTMFTAITEATVIADAAAKGDLATFAPWQAFAQASALGFAFLGLAVAVLGAAQARQPVAALPTWAAYLAVPFGLGAFAGWMLGPVMGLAFGGPVWLVSSILMGLWLVSFGIGLVRSTLRVAHAEVVHA
jgi:hypothetical protein